MLAPNARGQLHGMRRAQLPMTRILPTLAQDAAQSVLIVDGAFNMVSGCHSSRCCKVWHRHHQNLGLAMMAAKAIELHGPD